jgi:hypothetical protein
VLNRPTSVVELVNTPEMMARIPEDYVFIAETDHLLFKDLPNLATESMPAGYKFGYMMKNPGFENIIRRQWPEVQNIATAMEYYNLLNTLLSTKYSLKPSRDDLCERYGVESLAWLGVFKGHGAVNIIDIVDKAVDKFIVFIIFIVFVTFVVYC